MKNIVKAVAVAAFALSTFSANASVITFSGAPATSFADGTFGKDASSYYYAGFYTLSGPSTTAYNGYGVTGLSILFNTAMHLDQLTLAGWSSLAGVEVDLFDSKNSLLGSQSVTFSGNSESTLNFNANDVSKVVFNNIGFDGTNGAQGWYYVSNVNYSPNVAAVPEPGALALLAIGLIGFGLSRRRA